MKKRLQAEVEMLRRRLEQIESEDPRMVKSMDLDVGVYEEDAVQKEVIEENIETSAFNIDIDSLATTSASNETECMGQDTASPRHLRIQNTFTLCGNYIELSHHTPAPLPTTTTNMTSSEIGDVVIMSLEAKV
ncbi:hypothetical protein Tco_1234335 [Tanacetum coccineum]